MDYQLLLSIAESRLSPKYNNVIIDLKEQIAKGSTGGEISSMVAKYLKDLEFTIPEAFLILSVEIEVYLKECKKKV